MADSEPKPKGAFGRLAGTFKEAWNQAHAEAAEEEKRKGTGGKSGLEQRAEAFERKVEGAAAAEQAWAEGKGPMPIQMGIIIPIMFAVIDSLVLWLFGSVLVLIIVAGFLMLGSLGMIFMSGNTIQRASGIVTTLVNLGFIIYGLAAG